MPTQREELSQMIDQADAICVNITDENPAAVDPETAAETEANEKALQDLIQFSIDVIDPLIERIKAKYKGRNMQGRMTCPACKVKHALKVIHVLYRGKGNIRMFCDTENCIRLME